ncbi:sodium-independent anion transporter [Betaproteobacteria bacterium GR16-43]|nr:sodium-independent anion transporter [Betaproteobacteria bacterium GR16-43]
MAQSRAGRIAASALRYVSFKPRLIQSLRHYTRDDFIADLASGITVAVIALPLAMAFGIASGVRPEQGIATAIVAGFLISALGGSRVQIGGPAGAFVALLYSIAEKYGVPNLLIATMMAGVLLFTLGALRMGTLIRYIPVAIITGFTSGIAVIIALSQVRDFLGLHVEKMPANFFSQLGVIAEHVHTANPVAITIGLLSLLAIVVWPVRTTEARGWRKLAAKLPATIAVLGFSALAVWALDLPVETIGTRFGQLPRGLPTPAFPAFEWATAQNLFAPTLAIAILCAIESLLCARVADNLIDERHDPNQELMAQGIANFVSPFFGGIAATGTIARTVTNVKSGARTPVSGIIHAVVLFLIVLLLAPLASFIPLAALAAILLWVAFNMGEWREFPKMQQFSLAYRATMLTTFVLTVALDVAVAVQAGLILACLFFIYRMSALTRIDRMPIPASLATRPDGRRVEAWRVYGSLFFGSVTKIEAFAEPGVEPPGVLILELHQVINIDNTGLEAMEHVLSHLRRHNARLILVAPNDQPLNMLRRGGFLDRLGRAHLFGTLEDALDALESEAGDEGDALEVAP